MTDKLQSSLEQWTNSNKRITFLFRGQYHLYKPRSPEVAARLDRYARSMGCFSMVYLGQYVIVRMRKLPGMFLHPIASYDYIHDAMAHAFAEQEHG